MSGIASWLSLRYAACACGTSFLRLANAGGSRITTSNARPARLQRLAAHRRRRPCGSSTLRRRCARALRATYSSAVAEESTQVALAAPPLSALTAQAPDVAAHIEHARAGRQVAAQPLAIGGLVVEPAGLLAFGQRRDEVDALLAHRHFRRQLARHAAIADADGCARPSSSRAPESFFHTIVCASDHLVDGRFDFGAQRDRCPPCRSARRPRRRSDRAPGPAVRRTRRTPAGRYGSRYSRSRSASATRSRCTSSDASSG